MAPNTQQSNIQHNDIHPKELICITQHQHYYAECHNLFKAMLSVVMLSVVILSVVAPKRHCQIEHATYDCV